MQIHDIKRPKSLKKKIRIGRGGKRGTTSGRGTKGQKSRSGSVARPRVGFAGGDTPAIKRMPKLRGFKFSARRGHQVVNLLAVNKFFKDGEVVNKTSLAEKKLIADSSRSVKILGDGSLDKKLKFGPGLLFSEASRRKIIKAEGEINQ